MVDRSLKQYAPSMLGGERHYAMDQVICFRYKGAYHFYDLGYDEITDSVSEVL